MAWSTRQLAELAGTTVKAVRHYHGIGLLDEPERAANGYKQYGPAHLVRLIQIRRMIDLGLSLGDIAASGPGGNPSADAIALIDAELAATIDRLQRIRAELSVVLCGDAPIDVPPGFGEVAGNLSPNDRTMLHISSRILDERAMADLRDMLSVRDPIDDEWEALPADADEPTIQDLAERMAGPLADAREAHPAVDDPAAFTIGGVQQAALTMAQAMAGVYTPAQLEVLRRADALAGALRTRPAEQD